MCERNEILYKIEYGTGYIGSIELPLNGFVHFFFTIGRLFGLGATQRVRVHEK